MHFLSCRKMSLRTGPRQGGPPSHPLSSPSPGAWIRSSSPQTGIFVLGADIVYLSDTYPLLMDTLTHLCQEGAVVYLSSKMRREHGTPGFYDDILPQRFDTQIQCCDPAQNISLYHATLRRKEQMQ
uniref:Calmodulin-lysine N-methyltransferase n=1 Tax=Anguilla anguilla TaxID=7936 RepID=A0A0E9WW80_ANGAN